MKKLLGSVAMALAIGTAGLSASALWATITPTPPKNKCLEEFASCSLWAANQDTWYQRWYAEMDCEVDLAACLGKAATPWT